MRAALAILSVTLASCAGPATDPAQLSAHPYAIEVIVRTPENFHDAKDIAAFVDLAARNHVAVISVLAKQDEDGRIPSGMAYYASGIAPIAPGYEDFDVLAEVVAQAHARSIQVRAWVPQFHDQMAAKAHPSWQMRAVRYGYVVPFNGAKEREWFVNPLDPEVQDYELSILKEISAKYAVDGFMLDWIRFDDFPMDVGAASRKAYVAAGGPDPITIDFTKDSAARTAWNAWRTDGIGAYANAARGAIAPGRTMGIYVLPPEFAEVGQDAAKFRGAADTIEPMCYFRDWGFTLDWIWKSCMPDTVRKAGGTHIVPTLDGNLAPAQYRDILAHLRAEDPQVDAIAWFHHGAWDASHMAMVARWSRMAP